MNARTTSTFLLHVTFLNPNTVPEPLHISKLLRIFLLTRYTPNDRVATGAKLSTFYRNMSAPPSHGFSEEYLNANKGPRVVAIITVFPVLASITVFLRLYTRIKIVNNPSYEDFAILVALIFSIATSVCQGFQVYNGMGRHIQTLTIDQGIGSLKALFASIMMYNFGLTLTKISILLQYLRITVDPIVRKACYILVYITIFNCIHTFFTGVFTCYPVAKFWDDRIPGGCVNKEALWFANAAINIAQDISLVVLPVFILRKLALPKREKIGLILILGLGGFASVASCFRLNALHIVTESNDITWDNPGTATWSAMELNIGIICASLPTLRAFFAKYFPNTFTSSLRGLYHAQPNSDRTCQARRSVFIPFHIYRNAGVIDINHAPHDVEKAREAFPASDSSDAELRPGISRPNQVQPAP
ncbi:hypothetical protein BS50DRAFT_563986 [Corynespora cassiicola Philippines]|uniref:Rhodopsin domain-containing protein n=1 Tax=Corynespora cassiicola Philippines TaxID=1448308 RepID=A0A2T2N4M5_CORCC|nr:hypothetical protein BS50DRAFT_563986 [Corynespora cassiicola Philippines]